jgi:uncharacterized membrane protein YgcG
MFTECSLNVDIRWRLGTRAKNNGVLILLVTKSRRREIEIGTGLHSAYNTMNPPSDGVNTQALRGF